jgi:hypothetical protein
MPYATRKLRLEPLGDLAFHCLASTPQVGATGGGDQEQENGCVGGPVEPERLTTDLRPETGDDDRDERTERSSLRRTSAARSAPPVRRSVCVTA